MVPLIALVAAFVALSNASDAAAEVLPSPASVDQIVLMDDGQLEGCGFKASYRTAADTAAVSVIALRANRHVTFVVRANWTRTLHPGLQPSALVMQTGTMVSSNMFPAAEPTPDGGLETRASLPGVLGARFIQSVMVAGGRIELESRDGSKLALELPGPLPQLVRASYLNCAGDLYRPIQDPQRKTP